MEGISKVIKEIRKRKGLSQKEFGKSLMVSQAYISMVEHGNEIPSTKFVKLLQLIYLEKNNTSGNKVKIIEANNGARMR